MMAQEKIEIPRPSSILRAQEHHVTTVIAPSPTAATTSSSISASNAFKDILFGSIAGMLGKVIEFPFDTVKVRLQSQPDDRPLRYRGPIDCFRQSIQQDGFRSLYRGISPPLVGAAAENSALFFSYSIAQTLARTYLLPSSYSEHPEKKLPLETLILCGAISGSFASIILTPIELIKCKMQVPTSSPTSLGSTHPGPIKLITEVVRAYGIKGLWHGQLGTFLRETGGSAAWFGAYEGVSMKFRQWGGGKEKTSSGEQMLAGALAGVSYNFFLFPADSIKSKMQTEAIGPSGRDGSGTNLPQKGFWAVGKGMYKAGGTAALYRGCGITCLRSAPSSAIIFLCYETLKAQFADV